MSESNMVRQALAAVAALCIVAACATQPPKRSDAVFESIPAGTSMEQVRDRLGKPDEEMAFPATRTTSWTYFYYDTWGFYSEESLTFDQAGRLVDRFSKRVGYGGGSGMGSSQ